MRSRRWTSGRWSADGFTIVEVLIVVSILGILAALVVPQFSNAAALARENSLREDLRYIRTQIQVYASEHHNRPPGHPGGDLGAEATEEAFDAQMLGWTDATGNVGAAKNSTYRYGPYLHKKAMNPVNALESIRIIEPGAFPTEASGTDGWIYQPSTLSFAADAEGMDSEGTAFIDY